MKVQRTPNNQYIVTIPKALAEALDLTQGTEVEFKLSPDGSIIIRKK